MRRICYFNRIKKRGWLGIPYTVLKLRTAHVDERTWNRLKRRPFSMQAMMCRGIAPDPVCRRLSARIPRAIGACAGNPRYHL